MIHPEEEHFIDRDREVIEGLQGPIEELLDSGLGERLSNDDYQLIIGEDASGRLPALVVYQVAKRLAKANEQKVPQILFLAGSRKYADKREKQARTEKELRRIYKESSKDISQVRRALIVTEYVASGHSPLPIIWALQNMGISVDLATISSVKDDQGAVDTLGVDHFYQSKDEKNVWGDLLSNYRLGGVEKNPEDIFSYRTDKTSQGILNEGRKIIARIAQQISDEIGNK